MIVILSLVPFPADTGCTGSSDNTMSKLRNTDRNLFILLVLLSFMSFSFYFTVSLIPLSFLRHFPHRRYLSQTLSSTADDMQEIWVLYPFVNLLFCASLLFHADFYLSCFFARCPYRNLCTAFCQGLHFSFCRNRYNLRIG